ncbi:MAG: AmmeMemoRadiSam system protein B [Opitutae bacterium]|nr:AmmeMemoRadiSam system protein B [Opitutae bacterium]
MNLSYRNFLPTILGVTAFACAHFVHAAAPAETSTPPAKVRAPAVAGLFYPKDAGELSRAIDGYLAAATATAPTGELKALICPHAGYAYSGPVAANAYRLLAGREFATVVLLAPSHYATVRAAAVSGATVYRTPLGDVPISAQSRALAQLSPFALEPRAFVHRPDWWRQASHPAPEPGDDTADTWEHSDEVQVPFLQKTLKNFQLLPVIFGQVDPAAAARALNQILEDRTLIVASSDLSHYDSYARAQQRDRRCLDAICALDAGRIDPDDACGALPVQTLLHVAKHRGWRAQLLDYRNSGDTSGDKTRGVVGYAAVAFYAPPAEASAFNATERQLLLALARRTLRAVTAGGELPVLPVDQLAAKFTKPRGCFVTLTQRGALRGCIGHIVAQEPLHRAIVDNARSAATRDPRFRPVTAAEVDQLEIEISVLTAPEPLAFASPADLLQKLQPHRDGVVLQIGDRGATYLPQVWEQIPDKETFLDSLAEKAGCPASAWRRPGTKALIYRVESFKESDAPTKP